MVIFLGVRDVWPHGLCYPGMPVSQDLELYNSGGHIFVNLTFPWYENSWHYHWGYFEPTTSIMDIL